MSRPTDRQMADFMERVSAYLHHPDMERLEACVVPISRIAADVDRLVDILRQPPAMCTWKRWPEEDDGDTWGACAGNAFALSHGGPLKNGFRHCPYCGLAIVEA